MQLVKLRGTVSAVASDGDTVVVGVVGDLTHVYRRSGGDFIRLHSGAWASAILLDGDTLLLVGGATGELRAFGLNDGAPRPAPEIENVRAVRRWRGPGTESGLVAGSHLLGLTSFDAQRGPIARFGLERPLEAFDVHGTTVVATFRGATRRAGPVRVFDCLTGKKLRATPDGHTGAVLAVHLDARGLLTSSLDGTIRAYDATFRFVRAAIVPGGQAVRAFHADPADDGVVHAITGQLVSRLDRETLEVQESVTMASPYAALSVDARGRLVGVEGGVESLDDTPAGTAPIGALADVRVVYERDGYFDKDAQGWCAHMFQLSQEGNRVLVHDWLDENGCSRGVTRRTGMITRVEGRLAILDMDDGATLRFDLDARRLV
jgi:hypothetical protein